MKINRRRFTGLLAFALACARPVITTDVTGCRAAVDERVSGVVVPPGDANALARAIESFLKRPHDVGWMGRAARCKAERRFDSRSQTKELLEILDLAG